MGKKEMKHGKERGRKDTGKKEKRKPRPLI